MPRPASKRFRSVVIAGAGAGAGLGREAALKFASEGYVVFGTARSVAEVHDLKAASGGRVSLAACDITNAPGVRAWADGVSDALDGAGLGVLVNIPDDIEGGPLEAMPLDTIRRELEVNVLGAVSIINAFLPSLRIAHGRVIQVSSWIANLAVPFSGPSAASMAALKALSAAYRAEVRPAGVDVVMVTTGLIRPPADIDLAARTVRAAANLMLAQRDLYGKRMTAAAARLEELAIGGADLGEVAARVVQIAQAGVAASHEAVGDRAIEIAAAAQTKNDAELEAFRLSLVGLSQTASLKR
jgi:NAD(P)-dependent dehydrogenase (short-subunit alcohol dehydrogenase family)